MWVMTPGGFVSIVEKWSDRGRGTLTVRSRDARSLNEFAMAAGRASRKYRTKQETDYPYRDTFSRAEVGVALLALVADVTYTNFKNEAMARRGKGYASALGRVWTDLLDLTPRRVQERLDREWRAELRAKAARRGRRETVTTDDLARWDVYAPGSMEDLLEPEQIEEERGAAARIADMTEDEWLDYLKELYPEETAFEWNPID